MFLKRIHNRSGVILMVVIAFILMMGIFLAGIFSRNISSQISSISQAKSIRADLLARGAYWVAYNKLRENPDTPLVGWSEVIDRIQYNIEFIQNLNNEISVRVTYPQ